MNYEKKFNGDVTGYLESFFDISEAIGNEHRKYFPTGTVKNRHDAQGHGGLYELAEELADKFQKIHSSTDWGENEVSYFDEIGEFIENELNIEVYEGTPRSGIDLYCSENNYYIDLGLFGDDDKHIVEAIEMVKNNAHIKEIMVTICPQVAYDIYFDEDGEELYSAFQHGEIYCYARENEVIFFFLSSDGTEKIETHPSDFWHTI